MAEKLFSESEAAALTAEFKANIASAMAGPDAKIPVAFTQGWVSAISRAIASSTKWAVRKSRRELDEQREIVGGVLRRADKTSATLESLERRASRHADHLANLEDRVKKLERGGK